jgi:hypothetical protein
VETAKVNLIVNATIQKLPHCMKAVSVRPASPRVAMPLDLSLQWKNRTQYLLQLMRLNLKSSKPKSFSPKSDR